MKIAEIILKQLGGMNRLSMMIGAKDFFSDGKNNETLSFNLKRGAANKISNVCITLNSMDTYDVSFNKVVRKKDKQLGIMIPSKVEVSKVEGCYVDMLKNTLEQNLELYLSL